MYQKSPKNIFSPILLCKYFYPKYFYTQGKKGFVNLSIVPCAQYMVNPMVNSILYIEYIWNIWYLCKHQISREVPKFTACSTEIYRSGDVTWTTKHDCSTPECTIHLSSSWLQMLKNALFLRQMWYLHKGQAEAENEESFTERVM